MATTNYFTVNGQILAEEIVGGAGRRNYGVDALGSVNALYDGTGTLQNQYWYTPYGSNLAQTGVAANPNMRWCGTWGYFALGAQFSQSYALGKHYDNTTGQSTTARDGLNGSSAYAYRAGAGPLDQPPNILTPDVTSVVDGPWYSSNSDQCGMACITVHWKPPKPNGIILQHIKMTRNTTDCSGVPTTPFNPLPAACADYFEVWHVKDGKVVEGTNGSDRYCMPGQRNNVKVGQSVEGDAVFLVDATDPPPVAGGWNNENPCTSALNTTKQPALWPLMVPYALNRKLSVDIACCGNCRGDVDSGTCKYKSGKLGGLNCCPNDQKCLSLVNCS